MKSNVIKGVLINSTILFVLWGLAIILYITKNNFFMLVNFGYLGTTLGGGLIAYSLLPREKKHIARKITQLFVGLYLFGFLGVLLKLNIQIEGVWFELLFGIFTAPIMHYLVAKIIGPLFGNRLYCGWACWTSMVLDLLPFSKSKGRVAGNWGGLRYVHFIITILIVLLAWYIFGYNNFKYFGNSADDVSFVGNISLAWFLIGNAVYYISGILLAIILKDNRAFCKYLCPITSLMKITSRFSLIKIKGDKDKCIECNKCSEACIMDIDIPKYIKNGKRVCSTECTLCLTCTNTCPENILKVSFGLDSGVKSKLRYREDE